MTPRLLIAIWNIVGAGLRDLSRVADEALAAGGEPATPEEGTARYFALVVGLNDYGYVPGIGKGHGDPLPDSICSAEDCKRRWGDAVGGTYWYARMGRSESPLMRYRIELMYQLTHQRPIGSQRSIGLAFARGLLAEKLGYSINWAAFAEKQCSRGRKKFLSFEDFRTQCNNGGGDWPRNEVVADPDRLMPGAADDWEVNRKPRTMNVSLAQGYDLRASLPATPPTTIEPPLFTFASINAGME